MERTMSTCYSTLPAPHQAEAAAYVDSGHRPSPLLLAVLENDLARALHHLPPGADLAVLAALTTWALLEAPVISRGGVAMTDAWMAGGGRLGRAAARQAAAAALEAKETVQAARAQGTPHLRVVRLEEAPQAATGPYSFHHIANTVARLGALQPL
jgi:hypothetical protein